ncbi:NAD(P)-dependent oxidoreductase [Lutimonas zeaxanthinifaciens]|uniref:NAD(P)-dependent oxidoreductase n=1 Tax=Lutimonas zeaxanthinifaciens TaxID=3060215 RepID=UPI00265D1935|nr:NAD(P)-dependent oxidoreductase [Lutimonas sp. YSD2104]WKK65890.1 NAD(P)-dependent oxidoreductase [Lutimonas sp. YSD2104]
MKFGIIRERKDPPDKRVVLTPNACVTLKKTYPEIEIIVEKSDNRTFSDSEYREKGIEVVDDVSSADVLLGVKEVPVEALIPNKKYFFFSHTIKEQPYNRDLLRAILEKNIELHDHEVITDKNEIRLVAFGRYAGIVGAYNGIRTFGLKQKSFELPKAQKLKDQAELIEELKKIALPNIKIVLTGKGRVSNGAKEMVDGMGMKEVDVESFLTDSFDEAVYCQIDVLDYNKRKDGRVIDMYDFFDHPEDYDSDFMRFAKVSDVYIAGHFYASGAPYIFTREDAKSEDFKIRVVADISCDIDGPVASTIRPSTIADPVYGYDRIEEKETSYSDPEAIAVMAVDNLPNELPRDASRGFSEGFVTHVIPAFFNGDKDGILERSAMTKKGKLTDRFNYLEGYVQGE